MGILNGNKYSKIYEENLIKQNEKLVQEMYGDILINEEHYAVCMEKGKR